MNEATKAALQIALNDMIIKREQAKARAEQYQLIASKISNEEIPEMDEKIRALQADLE